MEQKNLENEVHSETVSSENAAGDFVEKVSLVKPGVFDQERFDRMRKINPDFGHGLYLGVDPYIRKIREAIAYAKAHPVEGEDEKMAARRVHEWVLSQLPRINEEIQGETLRGDYLA